MNILPKKNWHVRNKDNVAKVKRDEAKAAAEEKEKEKRLQIAESEARLNALRSKHTDGNNFVEFKSVGHVNLFEREEQGKFNEDKNIETEREKKVEKEAYEKKIGLLTYLSSDKVDFKSQPWNQTVGKNTFDKSDKSNAETDLKRKLNMDPLTIMKAYTKDDKPKKVIDNQDDKYTKKAKLTVVQKDTQSSSKKTIEQLRAERLKREEEERRKVNELMNPNKNKSVNNVELDDRKRKYNSQFNPELSRR